jgi:hypothetical protein
MIRGIAASRHRRGFVDNVELFRLCLDKDERFSGCDMETLRAAGEAIGRFPENCLALFDFYQSPSKETYSNNTVNTKFRTAVAVKGRDPFSLSAGSVEIALDGNVFFAFLSHVSDCFLPVFPLGSAVSLKTDILSKQIKLPPGMELRVVITDRFQIHENQKTFAPYGGVLYPYGNIGPDGKIHFGPQLVKNVLTYGYVDEHENAYIEAVKEEFLLAKGLHSMSFATKEDLAAAQS